MQNQAIRASGHGHDFVFSRTHLRQLPPDIQKKAEVELKEDSEQRDRDIEELRCMLASEPGLNMNTTDAFLIRYLRSRKYDKERALKSIHHFFRVRKSLKDIFNETLLPSLVRVVFEKNIFTVLPKRDSEGRPVVYFQLSQWDASELRIELLLQALYLIAEKLLQDESVQICGITAIGDLKGITLAHLRQFRPILAYRFVTITQDGLPIRLKGVHLLRESWLIDMAFSLVKPFLNAKMKKRIFFHGNDINLLHKHFDRAILPTELGGTFGPSDASQWLKILLESEQEFAEDTTYGFQLVS